jgi:hypothetical protein
MCMVHTKLLLFVSIIILYSLLRAARAREDKNTVFPHYTQIPGAFLHSMIPPFVKRDSL